MLLFHNKVEYWKSKVPFFLLICLCAYTFILYALHLSHEFIIELDDYWLIINNPSVQEISFQAIFDILFRDSVDLEYQPLAYISFSIDYSLFAYNAFAMKMHTLTLHIINICLVYHLFRKMEFVPIVALCVAMIFALHPIQVENIAWTSCRRQVIFGLFYFLSLIQYLNVRECKVSKGLFYFKCLLFLLFTVLAFLAKLSAVIILPSIIIIEIFLNKSSLALIPKILYRQRTIILYLLSLITLFIYKTYSYSSAHTLDMRQDWGYSKLEYLLITLKSFGFFMKQYIVTNYYAPLYQESTTGQIIHNPQYYYYFLCSISLFVFAIIMLNKNKNLFLASSILIVTVAPTSIRMLAIPDVPWNNGDRFVYTATPFVGLAIYYLFEKILSGRLLILVFTFLFFHFSIKSTKQIKLWKNDTEILEHIIKNQPCSETYRKLSCAEIHKGNILNAYFAYINSKNAEMQNYINVPYWTHVQMAFVCLSNGDSIRGREELDIATLKTNSKIPSEDIYFHMTVDPSITYGHFINKFTQITKSNIY